MIFFFGVDVLVDEDDEVAVPDRSRPPGVVVASMRGGVVEAAGVTVTRKRVHVDVAPVAKSTACPQIFFEPGVVHDLRKAC